MINNLKNKREKEKAQINLYTPYSLVIDFNKYPLFNNLFSKEYKDKVTIAKELFYTHLSRFNNISYDITNIKNYSVYSNSFKNILYEKDNNTYKIINKKPRYKDISVLQILKVLLSIHKINKYDYKNSIDRIKNKKPLKDKIILFINSYYKTIKTNSNKNTISGLTKKQDKRLRINIGGYSVLIKNKYSKMINNHIDNIDNNTYSKDRLTLIDNIIKRELKTKIINNNKIAYMPNL